MAFVKGRKLIKKGKKSAKTAKKDKKCPFFVSLIEDCTVRHPLGATALQAPYGASSQ